MGKLINRIPGSRLLISSLPGSALRTMLNRSASLAMSTSLLKALPGKLDIKRHSPSILYFYVFCDRRNPGRLDRRQITSEERFMPEVV